jgi:magnesium transporter
MPYTRALTAFRGRYIVGKWALRPGKERDALGQIQSLAREGIIVLSCLHTNDLGLLQTSDLSQKGSWIRLTAPTDAELREVEAATGVLPDLLHAPLDDEELPRAEIDEGQTLIIVNLPTVEGTDEFPRYETIPLGIIVTNDYLITVCLEPHPILEDFATGKVKGHCTFKKTRFVFQILLRSALLYLRYLDHIDRKTQEVEDLLMKSTRNEEVIRLLNLSKSLTYFTTSLRSNSIVLDKLLRGKVLKMYPEDEDLLEDAITETRQAVEVAVVHSSILSGTMDAFASIISNNLNIVMRFLTSVTIILAIPTIVFSFFGMNVVLPFQDLFPAWLVTIGLSAGFSGLAIAYLVRRKMF